MRVVIIPLYRQQFGEFIESSVRILGFCSLTTIKCYKRGLPAADEYFLIDLKSQRNMEIFAMLKDPVLNGTTRLRLNGRRARAQTHRHTQDSALLTTSILFSSSLVFAVFACGIRSRFITMIIESCSIELYARCSLRRTEQWVGVCAHLRTSERATRDNSKITTESFYQFYFRFPFAHFFHTLYCCIPSTHSKAANSLSSVVGVPCSNVASANGCARVFL